ELAVGARFRLAAFTGTGKENLLCLTTHSTPLSPAPAITLVNDRYKLWNYVNSDTELMDIGPAVTNAWHTAYLYARNDGRVKLWWDDIWFLMARRRWSIRSMGTLNLEVVRGSPTRPPPWTLIGSPMGITFDVITLPAALIP